jgi:hypothetical protein
MARVAIFDVSIFVDVDLIVFKSSSKNIATSLTLASFSSLYFWSEKIHIALIQAKSSDFALL